MELLDKLNLSRDVFDGRVAVVTGAARGIGEQVARALAHLGAHAIILDIREGGTTVADQIRGNSRSAEFKQVDLTDLKALETVQQEILDTHGRVDILVNNASKLQYIRVAEIPMALWDELHQTTVRASAFLISKFLPVMAENRFGVIANTIAVEGLPYGAHFSSAMVGQRSMVLSIAGELGKNSEVSVFGFAPGVVDTQLVRGNANDFPKFRGMSQDEYIANFINNPGYDGLMPAEDCGASYVYCLAHAKEYHGQIADAFHPLINHGIIAPEKAEDEELARVTDNVDPSIWAVNDYIKGVSAVNRNLELRIDERTRDLEAANHELANQKKIIEDISSKLSRYLPQQVYESIFSGDIGTEIESRRKYLTVFFSDMRDFTVKTERLEPEAMSEILNTYFSAMSEIAQKHGGTIGKFIGDAILAFFGDPDTEGPEADAERCVGMAIEMQERMLGLRGDFVRLGLNDPLDIRIGINSGYCTVGNFGSFDRIDYTIIGTPVNVAARLQEACAPSAILVSRSTQALGADNFQFEPPGKLSLKGIVDKVETFEVLLELESSSRTTNTVDDQLATIREQMTAIDIEQLGDKEKLEIFEKMSKLLKR